MSNQKSLKSLNPASKNEALEVSFSIDYELVWGDWGSGANKSFSCWKPVVPAGYYALGHLAKMDYPKPEVPMILVKALEGNAIAFPIDFTRIWADNGSGSNKDGSFWAPVAPQGYVALGCVASNNYNKPAKETIVCIREDLTTKAAIGKLIWGDWGSGANQNVTFYEINASSAASPESKTTYITSGSFCAHASYEPLKSSDVANALCVELPLTRKQPNPTIPKLTSNQEPPAATQKYLSDISYLPCTMVKDDVYSGNLKGQVTESPFYSIEKSVYYRKQDFNQNTSDDPGTFTFTSTKGMTKTHQTSMTNTIGVSMTTGYSSNPATGGPDFSVTLSYSLALSETNSTTLMEEKSTSITNTIPANGAGALFSMSYYYELKRANGAVVKTWNIDTENTLFASYPS